MGFLVDFNISPIFPLSGPKTIFEKENPKAIFPEFKLFALAMRTISDAEQRVFSSLSLTDLLIKKNDF